MAEQMVTCPKCQARFPISKALSSQIEKNLRIELAKEVREREKITEAEYKKKLSAEREKAYKEAERQAKSRASSEILDLKKQITDSKKSVEAGRRTFKKQLAQEISKAQTQALKEAKDSVSDELKELREENRLKAKKLYELKDVEAKLRAERARLEAKEQKLEKDFSRRVAQAERKAEKQIVDKLETQYEARLLQQDKKLSDTQKQVSELQKKLEQSSQQLQGEVYELHLEKMLRDTFPDDEVKGVAKGKKGADVIQQVCGPSGNFAGTIVWESKDTKNFNKAWLTKLRSDQRRAKAELAVLVSTTLPNDFRARFGQVDGIWITDFTHAMAVATALRANLIGVSAIKAISQGKEKKFEVIYDYLTGIEFKHRVEAIVEAFVNMQTDLEKERLATERNFSKREKQIRAVLQNFAGMYGDMEVVVGKALPRIKQLELTASSS